MGYKNYTYGWILDFVYFLLDPLRFFCFFYQTSPFEFEQVMFAVKTYSNAM